jgi:L-histidine N-alpha-methyltransferase
VRRPPAFDGVESGKAAAQFAADIQYYLTQDPRQLPSHYLYDALGSALFEAICRLPWYGITRAERRLLARHGEDIFRRAPKVSTIVELGSGSGEKLRALMDAAGQEANIGSVHLVDVSPSALESSARALESLERIDVRTHEATYEAGLAEVAHQRESTDRMLVLFLGSNIGNFDPPGADAFLRWVRGHLRPRDALLIGTDLVKSEQDLRLAYEDPLGVTAAFNRNLLVRINRELGGDFNIDQFDHEAVWNAASSRVEMHLVAREAQQVRIDSAGIAFSMARGERIWTESSYKYRPHDIVAMLQAAGFRLAAQWIDRPDQFALTLVEAA